VQICSDRADGQRFYAFDRQAGVFYASRDAGATFNATARTLPSDAESRDLAAVPGMRGNVFLCTDSGLFRSTDGGQNFTKLDNVERALRIGFGKAAPGRDHPAIFIVGYLGATYGFYRSDDAGATWARINDDQHQFANISSITGDMRHYGRVYMGSSSRGVVYGEPE
jgi:photosystem II stability/assembly factor-like uncharacterized protein